MAKASDKGWMPEAIRKPDNDGTSKVYKPNQGEVFELLALVDHIAEGSDNTWQWLFNEQADGGGPVSSHFFVQEDGTIMQGAPIHYRTWTNGLTWKGSYYLDPQGKKVEPTWWRIAEGGTHRGKDPNLLVVTVEHSGYYNKPRTNAQWKANQRIMHWLQNETGIVYVAEDTLIGHCDISPVSKPNCPGPYFDLAALASAGNQDPLKTRKVPGIGGDKYCGEGFYRLYQILIAHPESHPGLAKDDEHAAKDADKEDVTIQVYERCVFKYKPSQKSNQVHLALSAEATKQGWV